MKKHFMSFQNTSQKHVECVIVLRALKQGVGTDKNTKFMLRFELNLIAE